MDSAEIRKRFLSFFEKRAHAVLPSAPLVPENDASVLFNTAGMQPLMPYLLGQPHPLGKRLVSVQKCLRTVDIESIGDNTHATFFEMLGNWSLGDYFKKEAIEWSFEFLTSKGEGLGLDANRLYVTVFEGDSNAPKDTEAFEIWKKFIPENRIYFMSAQSNWWTAGDNSPCGPDSEMFYDVTKDGLGDLSKEKFIEADQKQEVVEIWNDVFMEYKSENGNVVGKLTSKNIDTGSGLERIAMVVQGKNNIYETDLLKPIMDIMKQKFGISENRDSRLVADHVRACVFLIADGVIPSNIEKGYVTRRLLRRAIFQAVTFGVGFFNLSPFVDAVINIYKGTYRELFDKSKYIHTIFDNEEEKFMQTITQGQKEFDKLLNAPISGHDAFILFSTYGLPIELVVGLAKEKGIEVDTKGFDEEFKKHQTLSRASAEAKFKGGLAGYSAEEINYHTATHLLHQALRDVLGNHVTQQGSNITKERLRFDFSHDAKLTDEEKKKVEEMVNQKIKEDLPVNTVTLPKDEAEKTGALHFFAEKYPDMVTIHYIGDSLDAAYSKEFCGGPHVARTGKLGTFRIDKEEAVSQGVRRIKATLY